MEDVSVVINTLNAEQYLDLAIRSVGWAGEVVVADMGSTDRTVEIAESLGARVVPIPAAGYVEPGRAAAVNEAAGEWILILDADEVVPPALAAELMAHVEADRADVVMVRRLNYLLGRPTDHSGWDVEVERHPRFHRRGKVTYPLTIHAPLCPVDGAHVVDAATPLTHFNYTGVEDFIDRLNRYTTVEAAELHASGAEPSMRRAFRAAGHEIVWRYVRRRGYRHGWQGLTLAVLMAVYRFTTEAKLALLHEAPEDIAATYRTAAAAMLEG